MTRTLQLNTVHAILCLYFLVYKVVPVLSTARFGRSRQRGWITATRGGADGGPTISGSDGYVASGADGNTTASVGSSSDKPIEMWRNDLPDRLQTKNRRTLQKLRLGQTDVFLLGTAHVSNESSADAEELLDCIRPDCVFVELCDARIPLLEGDDEDNAMVGNLTNTTKRLSFFEKVRATQASQGGSRLQALSTVLLTNLQEDYADELGVELGGEFRKAHAYWRRESHTHLILGDRPLQLTLYRAWESLSWWPKLKVLVGLLVSSLRKPNKEEIRKWLESIMLEESDVLTKSFDELRKSFPTLYRVVIDERDSWLAAKLFQTCRALQGRRMTIVAIVGAGHVPGICQWLTRPKENATSPEQILAELTTTKRWANDAAVQEELIPMWIKEVSELQRTYKES